MNNTIKALSTLAAGSVAAFAFAGNAQAFILDSFTIGQTLLDTNADGIANDTTENPANPIADVGDTFFGDSRFVEARVTTANAGSFLDTSIDAGGNENLNISSGTNILGNVTLGWSSGTGLDITDGGLSDSLQLLYAGSDFSTDALLTVADSGGGISDLTFQTLQLATSGDTQLIPFTTFTGTADLTDITSIELVFTLDNPNTDLQIGFLETVDTNPPTATPEPGTLIGLAAFGLAGLAGRRLKK